jgi:RimJ/RimL family protein N-acetyltransferase
MKIKVGKGGEVLKWLDEHILTEDHFPEETPWIASYSEDGTFRGACCFTDYRGTCVSMHFAGAFTGWITLGYTRYCFDYVFNQLKCHRAVGLVRKDNLKALITDLKLGFTVEALLREADDDKTDMYLLSMLKDECKWLRKGVTNG